LASAARFALEGILERLGDAGVKPARLPMSHAA
jgi:hypothetical protein